VGVGFENPADRDCWACVNGSDDFSIVRVGAFYGSGKNTSAQKVEGALVSVVAPIGQAEVRTSYGRLKNKDVADSVLDKQFGLGFHHFVSKRTTLYADLVNERRDGMPSNRRETGYDIGIKHSF
jgi:predicted porin